MNKILKKLSWYGWMLRYWALWKYRRAAFWLALISSVAMIAAVVVYEMHRVAVPGEPRQAFWPIVWYIVVMVVAALIAYAMAPKPQDAVASKAAAPQVKDGAGVLRVYGEAWIDDSVVVGWTLAGTEAIKSEGGKK